MSLLGGVKTVNGAVSSGRRRNGVKRLVAGNLLGDSVARSWGGVVGEKFLINGIVICWFIYSLSFGHKNPYF